jgi:hypothetical protein
MTQCPDGRPVYSDGRIWRHMNTDRPCGKMPLPASKKENGTMKYCVVTIGNSDNKLTQREWSLFCTEVRTVVESYAKTVHFQGWSAPGSHYQNMCITFEADERFNRTGLNVIKRSLVHIAKTYNQNAIAFAQMDTTEVEMIGG